MKLNQHRTRRSGGDWRVNRPRPRAVGEIVDAYVQTLTRDRPPRSM